MNLKHKTQRQYPKELMLQSDLNFSSEMNNKITLDCVLEMMTLVSFVQQKIMTLIWNYLKNRKASITLRSNPKHQKKNSSFQTSVDYPILNLRYSRFFFSIVWWLVFLHLYIWWLAFILCRCTSNFLWSIFNFIL